MNALNRPVEMIATCSPQGELCPARFRIEGEDGALVTVRIRQIRRVEEIRYTGIESIRFTCAAVMGGAVRLFELRYAVHSHRWVFWRFLDGSGGH